MAEYSFTTINNGDTGTPAWANEIQNALKPVVSPPVTVTSNYTVATTDGVILADASGGALAVTLTAASANDGQPVTVKKIDSSTNVVTIKSAGGTVEGYAAGVGVRLVAQNAGHSFRSDGTNWHVASSHDSVVYGGVPPYNLSLIKKSTATTTGDDGTGPETWGAMHSRVVVDNTGNTYVVYRYGSGSTPVGWVLAEQASGSTTWTAVATVAEPCRESPHVLLDPDGTTVYVVSFPNATGPRLYTWNGSSGSNADIATGFPWDINDHPYGFAAVNANGDLFVGRSVDAGLGFPYVPPEGAGIGNVPGAYQTAFRPHGGSWAWDNLFVIPKGRYNYFYAILGTESPVLRMVGSWDITFEEHGYVLSGTDGAIGASSSAFSSASANFPTNVRGRSFYVDGATFATSGAGTTYVAAWVDGQHLTAFDTNTAGALTNRFWKISFGPSVGFDFIFNDTSLFTWYQKTDGSPDATLDIDYTPYDSRYQQYNDTHQGAALSGVSGTATGFTDPWTQPMDVYIDTSGRMHILSFERTWSDPGTILGTTGNTSGTTFTDSNYDFSGIGAGLVGRTIRIDAAGVNGDPFQTTIASYVSLHTLTLTDTPTSNVSNKGYHITEAAAAFWSGGSLLRHHIIGYNGVSASIVSDTIEIPMGAPEQEEAPSHARMTQDAYGRFYLICARVYGDLATSPVAPYLNIEVLPALDSDTNGTQWGSWQHTVNGATDPSIPGGHTASLNAIAYYQITHYIHHPYYGVPISNNIEGVVAYIPFTGAFDAYVIHYKLQLTT